LFDEIEKAHADVFNVLLQVLDDGRLTDGQGRTVDFRNTVVIMTSNLGSHIFREYEKPEKVRPLIMQELRNTLRPEFLNRIDEIVIFMPLDRAQLARIVDIQLSHLRRRLAERRIELEVTDEAKSLLAREGYDPTFGARPLSPHLKPHERVPPASPRLDRARGAHRLHARRVRHPRDVRRVHQAPGARIRLDPRRAFRRGGHRAAAARSGGPAVGPPRGS